LLKYTNKPQHVSLVWHHIK